jgi:hypothetical protein
MHPLQKRCPHLVTTGFFTLPRHITHSNFACVCTHIYVYHTHIYIHIYTYIHNIYMGLRREADDAFRLLRLAQSRRDADSGHNFASEMWLDFWCLVKGSGCAFARIIYICIYIYIHKHICIYINIIYIHIYMYVYTCKHTHTHIHVYVYICMPTHTTHTNITNISIWHIYRQTTTQSSPVHHSHPPKKK